MAIVWGVVGHPTFAYNGVTLTNQFNLIQSTGLRSYRVGYDEAGSASKQFQQSMINLGAARGIDLCTVLNLHPEDYTTESAAYTAGVNIGSSWSSSFPGRTWELGNEYDNLCIISGSGSLASNYDNALFAIMRGLIRGMYDGCKQGDPTAKTVVGTAGWHHYGFLQRLWADGVRWDISCFHWYSDMGDATNIGGDGVNHFQILKDSFGKPIYVTEVNARPLSMASRQAEATWLTNLMAQWNSIAETYDIRLVHIYELLDEPDKAAADPPEAIYGLYTETGVIKTMGTSVKNFLTANPSADPFAIDNAPFTTRSTSTSPLTVFRPNIQVGVSGAIRDTHMNSLVDALDQTTAAPISTKTASYTATTADNGLKIIFNTSTAVTLTFPSTLPTNWECSFVQIGTGQVTIQVTGGTAALRTRSGHTKLAGRYSQAYATVVSNTNGTAAQVVLTGDTAV